MGRYSNCTSIDGNVSDNSRLRDSIYNREDKHKFVIEE